MNLFWSACGKDFKQFISLSVFARFFQTYFVLFVLYRLVVLKRFISLSAFKTETILLYPKTLEGDEPKFYSIIRCLVIMLYLFSLSGFSRGYFASRLFSCFTNVCGKNRTIKSKVIFQILQ